MTNIVLPTFPALASGAIFVKGIANNGSAGTAAQYVTFAHSFQIGQLVNGGGLGANFGSGAVPCQVDVKTRYADGSAAHGIVTVRVPAVASGATIWGQFAPAAAPGGSPLSLASALGSNMLSIALVAPASYPNWAPSTVYDANALILPTSGNLGGYVFQFVNVYAASGTSNTTEPVWPQTLGGQVTDQASGGALDDRIIWTNIGIPFSGTLTEDLIALVKNSTDLWLSGPLAVQARAYAVLADRLRVQIDMTAYADGTILADIMVANDVTTVLTDPSQGKCTYGGTQAYTATLTLNGAAVFTSQPLTHNMYENWTWQVGTVPHITNSSQETVLRIVHDPNDFIAAQATQSYNTTLGVSPTATDFGFSFYEMAQAYIATSGFAEPLTNVYADNETIVDTQMGGVGGRPDIGPNNAWQCWWFVTADPTFQALSLECGKINGYVPWHLWNQSTGGYWTTDDSIALMPGSNGAAPRAYTAQYGASYYPTYASADSVWTIDLPHFPEMAYINYLLTGRRYFLDELNATTAYAILGISAGWGYRNYGQGLVMREVQVRWTAWGIRNLLYATYANPDGTTAKGYFRKILDNNLYWFLTQIQTYQRIQGPDLFGYYPSWDYGANIAAWEESYLFYSLALAAIMGHPVALQICLWQANFYIGLWTNGTNAPPSGFPPADAVMYDQRLFQTFGGTDGGTSNPYRWGTHWPPAQNWTALESLCQQSGRSNISNGEVVWFAGAGGGSGSYGDYGQLLWNTLANYITLDNPDAAAALNTLQTQVDYTGANSPDIDLVSWASQPLTMIVSRTINASQIFPHAAAPSATPINANPTLGSLIAAGSLTTGTVTQPITLSGAPSLGAVEAAAKLAIGPIPLAGASSLGVVEADGVLAIGPIPLAGAASLGAVEAAGVLALPPYTVLAADLSAAISALESVLTTIEQWEAGLSSEATWIEATLAGLA